MDVSALSLWDKAKMCVQGHVIHFFGYCAYRACRNTKHEATILKRLTMTRGLIKWLRQGMWRGEPYRMTEVTDIIVTYETKPKLDVKRRTQ